MQCPETATWIVDWNDDESIERLCNTHAKTVIDAARVEGWIAPTIDALNLSAGFPCEYNIA